MTTFTVSELGRVSAANYFRRGLVRRRKNVASVGSGWTEGEELRSPPPLLPQKEGSNHRQARYRAESTWQADY